MTNATPSILIWIVEETLSDGSTAFNVDFNGTILGAVDEASAEDLAQSIADAINANTNEIADVMR